MATNSGPEANQALFTVHFSDLKDPRRTNKGNFRHTLSDILLLTISAMLCGANDWVMVRTFGQSQLDWLRQYGGFENGIPSEDTLERVFSALCPEAFNRCFIKWIEAFRQQKDGECVALDGKTMRGAKSKKGDCGLPHIVSAFASENGLCLGQVKTSEKSNEITAIPQLLELLALKGCTVTIDAMGCQKNIAEKIVGREADYILAVKSNQGNLEQAVKDTLRFEKPSSTDIWEDFGHGRIEKRTCKAFSNLSHVENVEEWEKLTTIFVIESEVYDKASGRNTSQTRLYISSLPANAEELNRKARQHWSVENQLHWVLDVTFGEDGSRKRKDNQPENYNVLLKSVLTLLQKNDSRSKKSKNNKRLNAALDAKYREKLLGF